jgi:hypothetical protein
LFPIECKRYADDCLEAGAVPLFEVFYSSDTDAGEPSQRRLIKLRVNSQPPKLTANGGFPLLRRQL